MTSNSINNSPFRKQENFTTVEDVKNVPICFDYLLFLTHFNKVVLVALPYRWLFGNRTDVSEFRVGSWLDNLKQIALRIAAAIGIAALCKTFLPNIKIAKWKVRYSFTEKSWQFSYVEQCQICLLIVRNLPNPFKKSELSTVKINRYILLTDLLFKVYSTRIWFWFICWWIKVIDVH